MTAPNPPAFPHRDPELTFDRPGMSLRDWFAGQALHEFASFVSVKYPETFNVVAQQAYAMADAMLAARAEQPE